MLPKFVATTVAPDTNMAAINNYIACGTRTKHLHLKSTFFPRIEKRAIKHAADFGMPLSYDVQASQTDNLWKFSSALDARIFPICHSNNQKRNATSAPIDQPWMLSPQRYDPPRPIHFTFQSSPKKSSTSRP
jgi:hypothetical protein